MSILNGSRSGSAADDAQLGRPGQRTCEACKGGDHSTRHNRIGCLVIVGREPKDYVCQCTISKRGAR